MIFVARYGVYNAYINRIVFCHHSAEYAYGQQFQTCSKKSEEDLCLACIGILSCLSLMLAC